MVAFVTYWLYMKQFCKMHYNMTTVKLKFCEAVENLCEVHNCS